MKTILDHTHEWVEYEVYVADIGFRGTRAYCTACPLYTVEVDWL